MNEYYYFQVGVNRLDRVAKPQHSELRFCKDANGSVTKPREKCCNLIGRHYSGIVAAEQIQDRLAT